MVTQWSDGEVIAIDARRGVIAWRDSAAIAPSREYGGRRTGAAVVYQPQSLLTAQAADRTVILVTGPKEMAAFDAGTGQALWRRNLPAECEPVSWTGAGMVVVPECGNTTIRFFDVVTGNERGQWTSPDPAIAPSPALCELHRTECRLVVVKFQTWLLGDATLTKVPSLERNAQLAGERVVYQTGIGVAARRLTDETPLWSWQGRGQLIAADSAGVYLLTEERTVLELSPATGHLVAVGCASSEPNEDWKVGHIYPTGSGTYLALERVNKRASLHADDQEYYYGPRPVALVELYTPHQATGVARQVRRLQGGVNPVRAEPWRGLTPGRRRLDRGLERPRNEDASDEGRRRLYRPGVTRERGERQNYRRYFSAAVRKASFSSGVPMVTRTPSPANARTITPAASQAAANSVARSRSGSQTKFACVGGTRAATTVRPFPRDRAQRPPAPPVDASPRRRSARRERLPGRAPTWRTV